MRRATAFELMLYALAFAALFLLARLNLHHPFVGDQAAALMGGTLAATSHVTKATTRAAINTSPEPLSNIGMSLLGDTLVPASLWLSWSHPYLFFAALAAALVLSAVIVWVLAKFLRRLLRRVSGWFGAGLTQT